MKVILNQDLASLGEEGDIKDVAKGYARNYLFPRGIALPHTDKTVRLFESRREEIEARKSLKRQDASGLKERLEALTLTLTMPAGPNGKLYGAVTSQTIMEEFAKQGFQIERKRIELPGNSFKSTGKYKVLVKLYENAQAECSVSVEGQAVQTAAPSSQTARGRRRREADASPETRAAGVAETGAAAGEVPAENTAGEERPPAAVETAEAGEAAAE